MRQGGRSVQQAFVGRSALVRAGTLPSVSSGTVIAWYDAVQLGAADGAAVAAWADSSGNGSGLSQGTAANQPAYHANQQNGLPTVYFNGGGSTSLASNQYLTGTIPGLAEPLTIFIVAKPESLGNWGTLFDGETAQWTGGIASVGDGYTNNWYASPSYGNNFSVPGSADTTAYHIVTFQIENGSQSQIRVDGVQVATATITGNTTPATTLYLGAGSNGYGHTGYLGEMIFYSGALTGTDVTSVETYLRNKWFPSTTNYSETFSAALSAAGALPRSAARGLAGGVSLAGAQARSAASRLSASLSPGGAVARATRRGLAGTLDGSGTIGKGVGIGMTGSLSHAGSVLARKIALIVMSGGLSLAGAAGRSTRKALDAAASLAGSTGRATSRGLAAGLSPSGAEARSTAKAPFAGSLSLAGALSARQILVKILTASLSATGSVHRSATKALGGGVSAAGSVGRSARRALSSALGLGGSARRSTARGLSGALSAAGSVSKGAGVRLSGSLSSVGDFLIGIGGSLLLELSAGLSFAGNAGKTTGKSLAAALSWLGSLAQTHHIKPWPGVAKAVETVLGLLTARETPLGSVKASEEG